MALRSRAASLRTSARARAAALLAQDGAPSTNGSERAIPEEGLWPLRELYQGRFREPAISYGTARDLADSARNMTGLAQASLDMKNLQRCWAVKAILGSVEPGQRLVEIGAGEPLVAGLLSRLGYEVTVVDPYDGSGNGPREFEFFRADYPDLRFVRDQFPPRDRLAGEFGAVYSISVLEHVDTDAIEGLLSAADALLSAGGCQIHAVDHVLAGWGSDEHLERLRRIVAALGLSSGALDETLAAAERDTGTYFVSAEAQDGWRGALDYDDYPMRRIISVDLVAPRRGAG